jgi:phage terminase Nu1 subunit (DNA packaging protein)
MAEYVNQQTLAEKLGISARRVRQLVEEGKLSPPSVRGFDIDKAIGEYHRKTDPQKRHAAQVAKGQVKPPPAAAKPTLSVVRPVVDDDDDDDEADEFQVARAKRERHNANLAELKELQARGDLLRRDIVVAREFEIARKLRERIMAFPARIANLVPAEAVKSIADECESLVIELQEDASRIAEQSVQD